MSFRVASYNIRKCVGLDRAREPGRTLDILNALDADVIALQEADRRLGNRPAALPPEMIAAHSDLDIVPLALNEVSLGWHGNALLLNRRVKLRDTARIDLPGLEPRGAVLAEFEGETGPFRIVGVHLGLLRRYRERQLAAIRAAIARRPEMPTIVLGDFNEWSRDKGLAALGPGFTFHAPGQTFHAARPMAALDRLATGQSTELVDAGVMETDQTRIASDHLPIWADIAAAPEEDRPAGLILPGA